MTDDLRQADIRSLWHPCTDIEALARTRFPIIERAEGTYLYDTAGRALLDGIASWWCVSLGHSHPRIVEAIRRQAGLLSHCILGGMSHPRAIELAERLAAITPGDLGHAFFACDGASAVEAALKIAIQYWANRGQGGRGRFIALANGYHGDTLGCVGVGYVDGFHEPFRDVVRPSLRATSPHCLDCPMGKSPESCDVECFESMRSLIETHHEQTAAVIVEPLCQGAGGIRMYPAEYLRRLRRCCDERDLLMIADEIAVGFGRTGTMFACEQGPVTPDLMTIGKALTGGHMPMSAVLATDAVYDAFRSSPGCDRTFYHSHTFGGNPIAAAAALAALDIYETESIVESCRPRITQLAGGIAEVGKALGGAPCRSLGMIAVVELPDALGGAPRARSMAARAIELGLFIRPLGRCVYLWPPLTTSESELARMLEILSAAAEATPAEAS